MEGFQAKVVIAAYNLEAFKSDVDVKATEKREPLRFLEEDGYSYDNLDDLLRLGRLNKGDTTGCIFDKGDITRTILKEKKTAECTDAPHSSRVSRAEAR